jgi:adenylate cyclase class 2
MSDSGQETEAKFYILHLDQITKRLQEWKAPLIQPRVLEKNFRFDLPNGSLGSRGRVLRLRQDTRARLTYKGAGESQNGVMDRQEIEFVVEDFGKARQFLQALGYQESMYYEKYRTTYEFEDTLIMLDELPYGDFVEIEGETAEQIEAIATKLDLDWGAAIDRSYTALFEYIRKTMRLSFTDLAFENFKGIQVAPDQLDVQPADLFW